MKIEMTEINIKEGMGFSGFLIAATVIMVVLKVLGVLSWSWVWILLPLWIIPALIALMFVIPILLFIVFPAIFMLLSFICLPISAIQKSYYAKKEAKLGITYKRGMTISEVFAYAADKCKELFDGKKSSGDDNNVIVNDNGDIIDVEYSQITNSHK